MTVIAVPLGAMLAFLMERTDLPGQRWIEPLLLVPIFVSPMVLSFGYVVAMGPVGFYSVWATEADSASAPWNLYSLTGMAVIAGLTHVPNVYIVRIVGAEKPRLGRRGSRARRRRVAVSQSR